MTTQIAQQNAGKGSTKGKRCTYDVPGLGLVDGRSREGRLYGQAVADITSDLGGEDCMSRAQLELARRAAGLTVLAALAESRLLAGELTDSDEVSQLISVGNAQRRILATLGLERKARDAPSLGEYLGQRQGTPDNGEASADG